MFVLSLPEEATIVSFAGDLAVVVTAKHPEDAKVYATETVKAIKSWLETTGLTLRKKKEAVSITNRRKKSIVNAEASGNTFVPEPTIKYLGVVVDVKLSFRKHLKCAC